MGYDEGTSSRNRRRRYAWIKFVILTEAGQTINTEGGSGPLIKG